MPSAFSLTRASLHPQGVQALTPLPLHHSLALDSLSLTRVFLHPSGVQALTLAFLPCDHSQLRRSRHALCQTRTTQQGLLLPPLLASQPPLPPLPLFTTRTVPLPLRFYLQSTPHSPPLLTPVRRAPVRSSTPLLSPVRRAPCQSSSHCNSLPLPSQADLDLAFTPLLRYPPLVSSLHNTHQGLTGLPPPPPEGLQYSPFSAALGLRSWRCMTWEYSPSSCGLGRQTLTAAALRRLTLLRLVTGAMPCPLTPGR